jgi:hypothetical protein
MSIMRSFRTWEVCHFVTVDKMFSRPLKRAKISKSLGLTVYFRADLGVTHETKKL